MCAKLLPGKELDDGPWVINIGSAAEGETVIPVLYFRLPFRKVKLVKGGGNFLLGKAKGIRIFVGGGGYTSRLLRSEKMDSLLTLVIPVRMARSK